MLCHTLSHTLCRRLSILYSRTVLCIHTVKIGIASPRTPCRASAIRQSPRKALFRPYKARKTRRLGRCTSHTLKRAVGPDIQASPCAQIAANPQPIRRQDYRPVKATQTRVATHACLARFPRLPGPFRPVPGHSACRHTIAQPEHTQPEHRRPRAGRCIRGHRCAKDRTGSLAYAVQF